MSGYVDDKLLPPLVNEYITNLSSVKDLSPLTVREYKSDLRLFFRYMVFEKENNFNSPDEMPADYNLSYIDVSFIEKITLRDVNNFIGYCNKDRANNAKTRSRKASSIRGFFKYVCDKMKYIDVNPVMQLEVAKPKKALPKYLTLEQCNQLLAAVEEPNKARDYCILTLFLNCGLRLAELVSLNVTDVNLTEKTIIVTGKGNKQRMLYLNKACELALTNYLKERPHDRLKGDDKKALFISRLNKRIGRQSVQLMVYHYLDKIGLNGQHYSVHKLRHTAATLMYQHGDVDVVVLKEFLGHESLATTDIYTHIDNRQLRQAAKSNPLSQEASDEDKE